MHPAKWCCRIRREFSSGEGVTYCSSVGVTDESSICPNVSVLYHIRSHSDGLYTGFGIHYLHIPKGYTTFSNKSLPELLGGVVTVGFLDCLRIIGWLHAYIEFLISSVLLIFTQRLHSNTPSPVYMSVVYHSLQYHVSTRLYLYIPSYASPSFKPVFLFWLRH